jgi:Rha family phage regulatory protein
MNELVITNQKGREVTTSLKIAEKFGKEHFNVIRDIEQLSCSQNFNALNFEVISYVDKMGREQRAYELTKDGFSFLVMGYTGEKASQFKEDFISEFNKREAMLRSDDYILGRAFEIQKKRIESLTVQMRQKDEQLMLQSEVIQEQAPKVGYYEEVLQSKTAITITVIAKELGMSAARLDKILFKEDIIYKSGKTWVLYAKYANKGYTITKTHKYLDEHNVEHTHIHTYWTEKGRQFVHEFIKSFKSVA